MIELRLEHKLKPIDISDVISQSFQRPIVYYLINKNDCRKFFITFAILNFIKKEICYLFSYLPDNEKRIEEEPDNNKFSLFKVPHCTINILDGEDFFVFMQEEEFFIYVNYKTMIMRIYTMNDVIQNRDVNYKRFSSTFYKDDADPNYFYMSLVDEEEYIHIFRTSVTLDDIVEIDSFKGKSDPPHALRKYKNYLFLSHEFYASKYNLTKKGKIVDTEELSVIFLANETRLKQKANKLNQQTVKNNIIEERKKLLELLEQKFSIRCVPGKIIMLDINTKNRKYYTTSGGSPAHFEIDSRTDTIYTSSHNFFNRKDSMTFVQPAIIDKFRLVEGKLELVGSFSYEKGFRYASHRVFYHNERPYICTFAQPNRLLFIDAEKMELLFYDDIGEDELTEVTDVSTYLSSRVPGFEIVAIEVSQDENYIMFLGPEYIYFYNFSKRKLETMLKYMDEDYLVENKLHTVHINYLY